MLFAITCLDKPDSLSLRQATRPEHLAYADGHAVMLGGPLLDAHGQPTGSLLLIEAADEDAARAFAANDPYAKAGLFQSTEIRAFRTVFRDGKRV